MNRSNDTIRDIVKNILNEKNIEYVRLYREPRNSNFPRNIMGTTIKFYGVNAARKNFNKTIRKINKVLKYTGHKVVVDDVNFRHSIYVEVV